MPKKPDKLERFGWREGDVVWDEEDSQVKEPPLPKKPKRA